MSYMPPTPRSSFFSDFEQNNPLYGYGLWPSTSTAPMSRNAPDTLQVQDQAQPQNQQQQPQTQTHPPSPPPPLPLPLPLQQTPQFSFAPQPHVMMQVPPQQFIPHQQWQLGASFPYTPQSYPPRNPAEEAAMMRLLERELQTAKETNAYFQQQNQDLLKKYEELLKKNENLQLKNEQLMNQLMSLTRGMPEVHTQCQENENEDAPKSSPKKNLQIGQGLTIPHTRKQVDDPRVISNLGLPANTPVVTRHVYLNSTRIVCARVGTAPFWMVMPPDSS
ncbi:hypothetical protein Pelo_3907 [Pelomyxa schiedti]|nr:hypothetical protein Pelo_3907 [Pelomyxa schiedti]